VQLLLPLLHSIGYRGVVAMAVPLLLAAACCRWGRLRCRFVSSAAFLVLLLNNAWDRIASLARTCFHLSSSSCLPLLLLCCGCGCSCCCSCRRRFPCPGRPRHSLFFLRRRRRCRRALLGSLLGRLRSFRFRYPRLHRLRFRTRGVLHRCLACVLAGLLRCRFNPALLTALLSLRCFRLEDCLLDRSHPRRAVVPALAAPHTAAGSFARTTYRPGRQQLRRRRWGPSRGSAAALRLHALL